MIDYSDLFTYAMDIGALDRDGDNFLVRACDEQGLTQRYLSERTGIAQPRLSRLWQIKDNDTLRRKIKLDELDRVLRVLYYG
jgi:transcriptional regulator with XRE-family HTH domain